MNSIKFKSNAFVLLLIMATVGILSFLTLTGIKHYQEEQLEAYLATQARTANVMVAEKLNDQSARAVLRQMTADPSMRAALYDLSGKLIRESRFLTASQEQTAGLFKEKEAENLALQQAISGKIAYKKLDSKQTKGDPLVDYYAPLYAGETQIGVLRLTYRYQSYLIFYKQMLKQTLSTAGLVFVLAGMAGLWYFGRQASRMERLKTSVEAVAKTRGELNEEIESLASRKDEYGVLARSVSEMGKTIHQQFEKLEKERSNLTLAIERLKEMEGKQRQFFGNITHEFKTPLSVINACNDLVQLYPDDRELLRTNQRQIKTEVQKLSGMVEQALELAKTERYDFEVQWEQFDFRHLCEAVIDRLSVKAAKYEIGIEKTFDLQPYPIRADREAVEQVLSNLLDNAIKYNRRGGKISLGLFGVVRDEKLYWQVSIADEGMGMSETQVATLFQPFASTVTENLTEVKGSGLGLALSQKLAKAMNGNLYLEKTSATGTCFIFEMPQNEMV